MEIVGFNLICFIIEYLKLILLVFFLLGFKIVSIKRTFIVTGIALLTVATISCIINLKNVVFGYTIIILLFFSFIIKEKKNIFFVAISYVYICITDMTINGFLMYVFDINVDRIENDKILYILLNIPSLVIFFLLIIINYKRLKNIYKEFSYSQVILLLISGLTITFYITFIQLFAFSSISRKYIRIAAIALSFCSIVFIVIFIKLTRSTALNKNLKNENKIIKRMLTIQRDYYQVLIEKENATKAFRHDIRNHLYCINTLYKEGKKNEFELYLSKLTSNLCDLTKKFDTGNQLVDAILNDLSDRFKEVKLSWSGHLSDKIEISSYNLCTIFSNILKNAYEASEKTSEKKISVYIGYMGANLRITIKNSAVAPPVKKNNRYMSDKEGSEHGFGLMNVTECIEEIGGLFEMNFLDNIVTMEIVLYGVFKPE